MLKIKNIKNSVISYFLEYKLFVILELMALKCVLMCFNASIYLVSQAGVTNMLFLLIKIHY